ncbi:hypothetical protein FC18_GL001917 [Lacticaseibacillus sharpeae JCM 1186 = DSM 20505]|uniref:DUF4230 domain-containing protein n=2 Tax=Lacticaseibacillus sharpeae TaxID=1626 RepID=A0A0R1ZS94_9LACO|nr:hypothetical protein FC18_GL001917 [Lacticaseibacillus sharpeae JCM 1186 = DSM 20505]
MAIRSTGTETEKSTANYDVKEVGQLDTTSIYYDKVVKTNEVKKFLNVKVGKETSLYIFHFKAQIYYNLDKAHSDYNESTKTLTVTMPQPEVKLLLKDSNYAADCDYYKVKDSMLIADKNNKGLKIQKEAAQDVKTDILAKKDFTNTAQQSAKKVLSKMFSNDKIKVVCEFA